MFAIKVLFPTNVTLTLNPFSYTGKQSNNIVAEERCQVFTPSYHTSSVIIKPICRAALDYKKLTVYLLNIFVGNK